MKKLTPKKKAWLKPEVHVLNIKKDTFSGSGGGGETGGATKGIVKKEW